ncbi:MAG: fumarylacetoacetate hydrolase family protein [Crocinitomicaceae bacterium]|nr:fumarylacetoacetate hydrolase family protein [Crocinitomicaceae bacterium]
MKIICIGRNYVEHAKEMNAPLPSAPIFFMKPETALLRTRDFFYPKFTSNLHYECEIVLKIDKVGKNIDEKFAHTYYSSCTLGIDFTARDVQQNCKEKGLPWEIAKSFDQSAPLSKTWIPLTGAKQEIKFELEKNGKTVQKGSNFNMIFSFDQIIAYISKFITLKKGDLIFTGTPAGVGAIEIGDNLKCLLMGKDVLNFNIR